MRDPDYTAVFRNTNTDFGRQPDTISKKELRTVTYLKQSNFYAQLISTFDAQLNGLTSFSYFFETKDLINATKYNGWDFSGPDGALLWDGPPPKHDSFWYATNSSLLWYTERWQIGKDQIKTMGLKLTPSNFKHEDNIPTFSILGFPISFKSTTIKHIDWQGEMLLTKELAVAKKAPSEVNGSDMVANINYDFTERQYTLHYYKIKDMLTSVGGIRASVLPIIGFMLPFFGLWFLMILGDIIVQNARNNQEDAIFKLAQTCQKQLRLVQKSC